MKLSNLQPAEGSVRNSKRLGRGQGSGGGGTARRGHKGAKSRSGYSRKIGFEGGQMPLQRRLPKFGFTNNNRVEYKAINLDVIQNLVDATGVNQIDLGFLYNRGLTAKTDLVKILGGGAVTSAITIKVNAFSKSAIEAIEKAGGKAEVDTTFDKESGKDVTVTKTAKAPVEAPKKVAAKKASPKKAVAAKEEAPKKATKAKATKKVDAGDDLRKIEGIGPKIAELLNNAGIVTFANLSEANADALSKILEDAGSRYASHNPTTWPQQAKLAADGKWDELKELQDKLDGGRPE